MRPDFLPERFFDAIRFLSHVNIAIAILRRKPEIHILLCTFDKFLNIDVAICTETSYRQKVH